jgi:hypothetical protein
MQCIYCANEATWFGQENQARFRQFLVLGAALLAAGAGTRLLGEVAWSWAVFGIAAFVLLQALVKWDASRWFVCVHCKRGFSDYGWRRRSPRA